MGFQFVLPLGLNRLAKSRPASFKIRAMAGKHKIRAAKKANQQTNFGETLHSTSHRMVP
jgi:hypothetical protein